MDNEKKIYAGVCLVMVAYMLFIHKQVNNLNTILMSNNTKNNDEVTCPLVSENLPSANVESNKTD